MHLSTEGDNETDVASQAYHLKQWMYPRMLLYKCHLYIPTRVAYKPNS